MDIDIPRLVETMHKDRKALQPFREFRQKATRQLVGRNWSTNGALESVPINTINQFHQIYSRSLIAKNPRVMLSTFNRPAKATVSSMQSWANKKIDDTNLAGTLRRVLTDAFSWMGICKIALGTPADAARLAWNLNAGEAFAEVVDPDDWVCSTGARDSSLFEYCGHRIRVPLDVVKDSKDYSKARKKLEPMQDAAYNEDGDERISMIGRTWYGHNTTQFRDWVDLWEIYIPHERQVITLAADDLAGVSGVSSNEPLRVQNWIGRPTGPYEIMGFGIVPGSWNPLAPITNIFDLHMFINRSARKIMRQTDRVKDLLFVQGGADSDGNRVMTADDGEILRVDNPDKMVPASMGGANERLKLAFEMFLDHEKKLAGNLDLLGGLGAQSDTATQDKMLNQNAGMTVADMQGTTVEFTARVVKSLCWYWHHDPYKVMKTTWAAKGVPEISINRKVTPRQRMQVQWDDLDVKVDPYSLQHSTPQMKSQAITAIVTEILPLMPLLQQQGYSFDIGAYLQMKAEYNDLPELIDLFTIADPPQTNTQDAGEPQLGAPAQSEPSGPSASPNRNMPPADVMKLRSQMGAGINPGGNAALTAGNGGGSNGRRQMIA